MDMKNIFKLSVMMLATAFVAGCSQNEDFDSTPIESDGLLAVHATASDFASSDAKDTRIVNEDANTAFESGDEIGVFAIRSTDNKLIYQNLPLKYKDATDGWTGNDNKVYYYKNTTYVAYSPYDKNLSISGATGAEDLQTEIKKHFDKKLGNNTYNQLTMYPSLDLMLASSEPATGDKSLSFSFKHQMALVEIAVPVKAYLDESKAFTYAEPFTKEFTMNNTALEMYPLSIQTTGEANEAGAAAYGVYRLLVKPGTEYTLSGELEYAGKPVTLDDKTVNLAAGMYMKYTIQADNAVSSYTKRAIAVGDYYYADGSIYPGPTTEQISVNEDDMKVTFADTYQKPMANGCVGVIFAVNNVSVEDSDKGRVWNKGYVFALEAPESVEWYPVTFTDTYNTYTSTSAEGCTEFFESLNGYELTHRNGTDNKNSKALEAALNFGITKADYAVSGESTSGWFMPSPGELLLLINNFYIGSEKSPFAKEGDEYKTLFNQKANVKQRKCAAEHLVSSISQTGKTLSFDASTDPTSQFWLTSAEYDATSNSGKGAVWAMEWKYRYNSGTTFDTSNDQTLKFLSRSKSGNANKTFITRPILAF